MKVIFYNLGYCRGHNGSTADYFLRINRFFHISRREQKKLLDQVKNLIIKERPVVFLSAEVSSGSFKNRFLNQHDYLVEQTDGLESSALSKYGETILNVAPFHTGNCNGVITYVPAHVSEIYLASSRKKLVYKVETESLTIFSAHLPLVSTDRKEQLKELSEIVNNTDGNVLVCGDFNILDGVDELQVIQEHSGLTVVEPLEKTYPTAKPKIALDVALYRFEDKSIRPTIKVGDCFMSDHLPIIVEW